MDCIAEFTGDYTKMCCGGCVRFTKNHWKDGCWFCCGGCVDGDITAETQACEHYWDQEEQTALEARNREQDEKERLERWEKNKGNTPLPAVWKRDWDGMRECLTGAMPYCPNCDELLYDTDVCYFCGQPILQDDRMDEYNKPPETYRMKCLACGGENTMVYTVSNYNGHRHGRCEKCGASFME